MENRTDQFEKLLAKSGLRRTEARLKVLGVICSRDSATSQPYLEQVMGADADRVTLYRVLKAFEEKGIIHRVLDNQGTANYAICSRGCSERQHHDEHVHFNCNKCLKVYCLDSVRIPGIKIPTGFEVEQIKLIATGICSACSGKIN